MNVTMLKGAPGAGALRNQLKEVLDLADSDRTPDSSLSASSSAVPAPVLAPAPAPAPAPVGNPVTE